MGSGGKVESAVDEVRAARCRCWCWVGSFPRFLWVVLFNPNPSPNPYVRVGSTSWCVYGSVAAACTANYALVQHLTFLDTGHAACLFPPMMVEATGVAACTTVPFGPTAAQGEGSHCCPQKHPVGTHQCLSYAVVTVFRPLCLVNVLVDCLRAPGADAVCCPYPRGACNTVGRPRRRGHARHDRLSRHGGGCCTRFPFNAPDRPLFTAECMGGGGIAPFRRTRRAMHSSRMPVRAPPPPHRRRIGSDLFASLLSPASLKSPGAFAPRRA